MVTDDRSIEAFTEKMRALYAGGGPEIFMFRTREQATLWMDDQEPAPNFRETCY